MKEIQPDVYYVGVNDRSSDLFEGQWPLPEGISYNSYLIDEAETVLIDTVDANYTEAWLEQIATVVPPGEVDYLVVNHAEPDHSGSLPVLRRLNPELTIVGNEKTAGMLEKFYGLETGIETFGAGETLEVGSSEFNFTPVPFVHWPESMVTFEANRQILFSNDVFGAFGVLEGGLFHDETALDHTETEMLRYFSNIIGAFTTPAAKALDQLGNLEIELIAPGHGPLWKQDQQQVMDLYQQWSAMEGAPGVTVIYATMYNQTKKMMEAVVKGVRESGVEDLRVIDAARTHPSFALGEAWRRSGLLIGSPTYGNNLMPQVHTVLHLLEEKTLQNRTAGFFGSHGWSGGAIKNLNDAAEKLGWELPADAVKFSGRPEPDELEAGRKLGRAVGESVQQ